MCMGVRHQCELCGTHKRVALLFTYFGREERKKKKAVHPLKAERGKKAIKMVYNSLP